MRKLGGTMVVLVLLGLFAICGTAARARPADSAAASVPGGIALGIYEPAPNPFRHGAAIDRYAEEVGRKPAYAWFSVKWENGSTGAYQEFDPRALDQFRIRGIMPGLNWDASRGSALNKDQPDFSWRTIASGKHDAYIIRVAKAAAAYQHPFLIRLFTEMDGSWYPWGFRVNGNTSPADFVAAWKHVVGIFRREGATNVRFVWCLAGGVLTPNRMNKYGDTLARMYPGDDYVDWVAVDGYTDLGSHPRSLQAVFQTAYQFLLGISRRPLMFSEVGATEDPSNPTAKADWITQGFLTTIPTQFPKVKEVNWFNAKDDHGFRNYALNTSRNALDAWRRVVASPLYQAPFPR